MNIILFISILVILLVVIVLIIMKMGKKTSNTKVVEKKINIKDLLLPKKIEHMDNSLLMQACKIMIDSYKALDYANKVPSTMDKLEWHSWQVSILIKAIKNENNLKILDSNKIFHSLILQLNQSQIKEELEKIVIKYSNRVNIEKDRDNLSKDMIWSAREVAILLFEILKK